MTEEETATKFSQILESLTVNSRPIIEAATKTAEQNVPIAQTLVEIAERRLEKCIPTQKLLVFYVIDSICKNVGSPYTVFFSINLFKMYKQTYLIVDNTTRTKLINLFKTWKKTASGVPLFNTDSMDKIEGFLIKASALQGSGPPPPTVPVLLKEVDALMMLTGKRVLINQSDLKAQNRLQLLQQLKIALQNERMPPAALKAVQKQLRDIAQNEQELLKQIPQQAPVQQMPQQAPVPVQMPPQQYGQYNGTSLPPGNFQSQSYPVPQANFQAPVPSRPVEAPRSAQSGMFGASPANLNLDNILPKSNTFKPQAPKSSINFDALYKAVIDAGLVKPPPMSIVTFSAELEREMAATRAPPISVLTGILTVAGINGAAVTGPFQVELTTHALLNTDHTTVLSSLYTDKPNKCSTCGKRFGSSNEENEKKKQHLDWHFRTNKRLRENSGKLIQSRAWYLSDDAWSVFKDAVILGNAVDADGDTAMDTKPEVDMAALAKKYVVVPESSEDMTTECGICKETLRGEFNDAVGEWCWMNCVKAGSRYFHATCHYEVGHSS